MRIGGSEAASLRIGVPEAASLALEAAVFGDRSARVARLAPCLQELGAVGVGNASGHKATS